MSISSARRYWTRAKQAAARAAEAPAPAVPAAAPPATPASKPEPVADKPVAVEAVPPAPAPEVEPAVDRTSLVSRLDAHERTRGGSVPSIGAAPAREPRFYLTLGQDVVDAPSIGPKTADRLIAEGVNTVGDLMDADAETLAELLDVRHITAETIRDWQAQSALVMSVPNLRGTHAQLIIGAGFRDAESLAAAEPDDLCARVLAFATSREGQRVLRDGSPPDLEAITAWGAAARRERAA